jgi:hypothetical protein
MSGIGALFSFLIREKIIHFIFYNITEYTGLYLIGIRRVGGRICKRERAGAGGFDTKPEAERMGSVLMGNAWGSVVEAGASKNKPATEHACSVTIGDEAGAGKIEWGEPTNGSSECAALSNGLGRDACSGCGRRGGRCVEGRG